MPPAMDHAQTSHLAVLGSSTHCGGGPDEALGRVAREVVHPHCLGNVGLPKGLAAVARTGLGHAPGPVHPISIVGDFGRITRRRWASVASSHLGPVGRRIAMLSRLSRCALNPCRAVVRCGFSEPPRINARSPKPFVEPSHRRRLSNASDFHGPNHDRSEGRKIGKVFQYGA